MKDLEARRRCKKKAPFNVAPEFLKFSSDVYFITLTYNDQYQPIDLLKKEDGEFEVVRGSGSDGFLYRKDVVDFNKRLRIRLKRNFDINGLRVAYSGEYGQEGTHRPHFHLVVWNLGDMQESDFLDVVKKSWSFFDRHFRKYISLGHVKVEMPRNVSDCASYVTKAVSYVTKNGSYFYCRQGGEKVRDFCERTGKKTAPFLGFSQRLGLDYVEDNCKDLSEKGYCSDGVFKVSLPKYYQDKCFAFLGKVAAVDKVRRTLEFWKKKGLVFLMKDEDIDKIGSCFYYKWLIKEEKKRFRSKFRNKFIGSDICTAWRFNHIVNCVSSDGRDSLMFSRRFLKIPEVRVYYQKLKRLCLEYWRFQEDPVVSEFLKVQRNFWLDIKEEQVKQGALNDLLKFKNQAALSESRKLRRSYACLVC